MKRIFIIEDNDKDYQKLLEIVTENFSDVEVYPSNLDENKQFRKMLKGFFSPDDGLNAKAKTFMNNLKINEYDGILLDYELFPSVNAVTGILFYTQMKFTIRALILTKYNGVKLTQIKEIIQNEKLHQILLTQKGNLVILSEEQKQEHIKNINRHLFNDSMPESQLKSLIIEKLNKKKPKIIGASDSTQRETAKLTEDLIYKIENSKLGLDSEYLYKLEIDNEVNYLNYLKEINSRDDV